MSMDPGQRMHAVWLDRVFDKPPETAADRWAIQSPDSKRGFAEMEADMVPPNQLTSAELGKLVEMLERAQASDACPECDADVSEIGVHEVVEQWLPRIREAWLSLVRWEADHG